MDILDYLASSNVDMNLVEVKFQIRPLTVAIAMKHYDIIQFLMSKSSLQTFNSALILACSEGNLSLAQTLLQRGAELECCDSEKKRTPFAWACYTGHLPIVSYLIEKGAKVDCKDGTGAKPLHNASQNGQDEVVELLLKHGVSLNDQDNYGDTPLSQAVKNSQKTFIYFGCNPIILRSIICILK